MKKLISIFLLLGIVSTLAVAQKTIAIATFDIAGNAVSKDEADIITELYITELTEAGWVIMPNRAKFTKVLNDLKFQASDWSDASKTTKLANAMNIDVISTGKIMKLGSKLYIVATLIDAKTAQVLSTSKMETGSVDDIPNILTKFVADLTMNNSSEAVDGSYSLGDIGPGGGFVFHKCGSRRWEISKFLGYVLSYHEAIEICEQYRGGGYNDWYLPLPGELERASLIFHKSTYGDIYNSETDMFCDENIYRTSWWYPESCCACVMQFSSCETDDDATRSDDYYAVRAVRSFTVSER